MRSDEQVALMLLVADWHWRRGPRWRAILVWLLGRRESVVTYRGDRAVVAWWRGDPFLVSLTEGEGCRD